MNKRKIIIFGLNDKGITFTDVEGLKNNTRDVSFDKGKYLGVDVTLDPPVKKSHGVMCIDITDAPVPAAPVPVAPVPAAPVPAASVPAASVPAASVPAASVPAASVPAASVPAAPVPAAPVPAAPVPAAPVPAVTLKQQLFQLGTKLHHEGVDVVGILGSLGYERLDSVPDDKLESVYKVFDDLNPKEV